MLLAKPALRWSLTPGSRHWLDRLLTMSQERTQQSARALCVAAWLAILQGDLASAAGRLNQAETLGWRLDDEKAVGYVALFSGIIKALQGHLKQAVSLYKETIVHHQAVHEPIGIAMAQYRSALVAFLQGDSHQVHTVCDKCCSLCDTYHEHWWKAFALWVLGLQLWRDGNVQRATAVEGEVIHYFHEFNDRFGAALALEAFAWMAAEGQRADARRAATLLGAADTLWQALGTPLAEFSYLSRYHQDCEQAARRTCGTKLFNAAFHHGIQLDLDTAVRIALGGEEKTEQPTPSAEWSTLTPREREIAKLTTEGLSNKEIAARLVISQRTAEAHVEHILVKLGFSSRHQIAAWATEHHPN